MLCALERVNDAAFPNIQKSTDKADCCDVRPGRGGDALMCTRGEICTTPRRGREALRSWGRGASDVPGLSSPAPGSITLSTNTTTFLPPCAGAPPAPSSSSSQQRVIADKKPCIGAKATNHASTRASYRCTFLSWGLSRMGRHVRGVDAISCVNIVCRTTPGVLNTHSQISMGGECLDCCRLQVIGLPRLLFTPCVSLRGL